MDIKKNHQHSLSPSIFRSYDIRGIAHQELDTQTIYAIGQALGTEALEQKDASIITARDGRLSSPELCQALQAGILATGCNVVDIGIVPTPVLYFAVHNDKIATQSGVMLTGSHNPKEYNGLKMMLKGETLAEQKITALYERILANDFIVGQGQKTDYDISSTYMAIICEYVQLKRPLKIVIDAGNGVAGPLATALFNQLNCNIIPLFCDIDGHFPNHHPDPTEKKNLQSLIAAVRDNQADLGIAFDGDGDRLGVVTDKGHIIHADHLLMPLAQQVLQTNKNATIVYDVKCSRYLKDLIEAYEGQAVMARTGHSLIKNKMKETNAALAGEMSGHIFFKDRWYGFDDALYAAARLLEILSQTNQSADSFFQQFPQGISTPELRITLPEEEKFKFVEKFKSQAQFEKAEMNYIDGIRVEKADAWGLLRASNTTPCLILRFEADSDEALSQLQEEFRQQILAINPQLQLPF
jgi:phosphomannomutase/phosphoglucomutase